MSEKICNGCTNEENCETQEILTIPFVVHEKSEARHERREKRYITALIIAIVLLFVSNAVWLWVWMQYDYVVETTEQITVDSKDGGNANYIVGTGDIINGENNGKTKDAQIENEENI